jgi:hypothetical protein
MPCFITGTAEGDARLAASDARSQATEYNAMLCTTLSYLKEHYGYVLEALLADNQDIAQYWIAHLAVDAERKLREQERREDLVTSALNKLTDEEKQALGV